MSTKTAPKRRTAAELAAHHKDLAAQHERKARIATDPVFAAAVKLRDATAKPGGSYMPEALAVALDEYLDGTPSA